MMATKKMLRGAAPLTTVRGVSGSYLPPVYRSQLIDPNTVDADDRERLVGQGYLEWVVSDGETWKLAEDTEVGSAGDPVTVGLAPPLSPPTRPDPGTVNTAVTEPTPTPAALDVAGVAEREGARAKLPPDGAAPDGRQSKAVWVEYGVAQGRDRAALEALSRDELIAELKPKG